MSPQPVLQRPARFHKHFLIAGLGLGIGLLLCAFVSRALLRHQVAPPRPMLPLSTQIRRMMIPRLTLTQPGYALSVALTPDGRTLLTGWDSADYAHRSIPADVLVWDAVSGRLLRRLHGLRDRSNAVTLSPDGRTCIATGYSLIRQGKSGLPSVFAWDLVTGKQLWAAQGDMPLCWSPDGRQIGSANRILRATDATLTRPIASSIDEGGQNAFTPDGRLLGFIGAQHWPPKIGMRDMIDEEQKLYATTRLRFWRTDTGQEAKDLPFIRVRVFDIAHDGRWLVMVSDRGGTIGGSDGSVVRKIDFRTGHVLWTRERSMNTWNTRSMQIQARKQSLGIREQSRDAERVGGPFPDDDAMLNSVVISPNGKYVVLISIHNRLIVLDARTGREMFRSLVGQGPDDQGWGMPGGLAFSADGRTLVSRGGNCVRIWDARSLQ